jgi:hypothetical protein
MEQNTMVRDGHKKRHLTLIYLSDIENQTVVEKHELRVGNGCFRISGIRRYKRK